MASHAPAMRPHRRLMRSREGQDDGDFGTCGSRAVLQGITLVGFESIMGTNRIAQRVDA